MPKLQASGAFAQALDDNARALNGAYWKVYAAGTTTQATTYSNALLTIANAWPVIGNAAGRIPDIYVAPGNYRIRVETAGGVLVAESDNNVVYGVDPGEVAAAKFATFAAFRADQTVGYALGGSVSSVVAAGDVIQIGQYTAIVAASGVTDSDDANAAGVKVFAQPFGGAFHTEQFPGADIGAKFNAAVAAVKRERTATNTWGPDAYSIRVTPGLYAQTTMMDMIGCPNFYVDFTGAEITNFAGSFSSLRVINSPRTTIQGAFFNLRNNNSPDQAIWLAGQNSWVTLVDCGVMANTSNANFACVRLQQGNESGIDNDNRDLGNFWVTVDRFWCRKLTGGDSNNIPVGVDIQGAGNAFRCINSTFNNVGTGVWMRNQNASTSSGISNDVQILLTAFEGFTSAVKFTTTDSGDGIAGGTITNCRFETGTNVLEMSGFSGSPSTPLFLSGNTIISSVTNYVTTGNANWYNSMDAFWTPNLARPRIRTPQGMRIASTGAATSLSVGSVQASGGGAIAIERDDGTVDGRISQRPGGGLEIDAGSSGLMRLTATRINLVGIPTASTGVSGDIWNDAGTLKIVP